MKVEEAADICTYCQIYGKIRCPRIDAGDRPFAAAAGFVFPHCPYTAATKELGEQ